MEVDVLGTGESLSEYKPGNFTIGVNDVSFTHPVDILVVVDPPEVFLAKGTYHKVVNGKYKDFATILPDKWSVCTMPLKAVGHRGIPDMIEDKYSVSISISSPFTAAHLAWKLGATRINLYGVDFNTHPKLGKTDPFRRKRALEHFKNLYDFLKSNGCELFTTEQSALSSFVPVIGKKEIHL